MYDSSKRQIEGSELGDDLVTPIKDRGVCSRGCMDTLMCLKRQASKLHMFDVYLISGRLDLLSIRNYKIRFLIK